MKTKKIKVKSTKIVMKNDEPVAETTTKSYWFGCQNGSLRKFEELYGEPLLEVILKGQESDEEAQKLMMNIKFIDALSASTFLNVNGDVSNVDNNALAYAETDLTNCFYDDLEAFSEIVMLVTDSVSGNEKQAKKLDKKANAKHSKKAKK